jgi:dephospho-CoA kinase
VITIGLTGGIGSGKSTVAARLAVLGATIIDADQIAREVVSVGTAGLAQVVARFGPQMLAADGSLDRPRLGQLVFADPDALADLNAIVHPLVAARTAELMSQLADDGVIVYDVPLLAEKGMQNGFDAVIVVQTPMPLRIARLVQRGLSEQDARSRMASQASDSERRAVATTVLDNSGTRDELAVQVDEAWRDIVCASHYSD